MDFKKLKKYKKIIILGHDNIDVDSIISCILLNKLFAFKGINSEIKILDKKIDIQSFDICKKVNIDAKKYLSTLEENENVFLVDHHICNHKANIIGCIDHHLSKNILNYEYENIQKASSCSKMIYDIMEQENYPINKEIVEITLLATFVDTSSFRSTKSIKNDLLWAKEMCNKYNLNYDFFYLEGLALNNLNVPIDILSTYGFKKYIFNNKVVYSSYLQVEKRKDIKNFEEIIKYIKNIFLKENIFIWVLLIHCFNEDRTLEYDIYKNKIKIINHKQITSRGTTIIPNLEKSILEMRDKND